MEPQGKENRWYELLLRNRAILKGHFKLSSGLHSDTYIQCARILKFPWYAEDLGHDLASLILESAAPDLVLSPALGAIIIGHETAKALQVPFLFCEREEGVMKLRRSFQIDPGQRCWIIEDVLTTGKSTLEVAGIIEEAGGEILGCGAIVDRRQRENEIQWPVVSLVQLSIPTWKDEECPLCRSNLPLVYLGSRSSAPGTTGSSS